MSLEEEFLVALLLLEVDRRRRPGLEAVDDLEILRAADLFPGLADEDDGVAGRPEAGPDGLADVLDEADDPQDGRRVDGQAFGVVVEADVAARDRDAERPAGLGQAGDGLFELAHDLGLLGIAEVQAVGDADRPGPDAGQVPAGFGHGDPGPCPRIEPGVEGVAVQGHGQGLLRALDPEHGRVGAGQEDRVHLDHVVVLAEDPFLVGDRRRGEEPEEDIAEVAGQRQGLERRRAAGEGRGR